MHKAAERGSGSAEDPLPEREMAAGGGGGIVPCRGRSASVSQLGSACAGGRRLPSHLQSGVEGGQGGGDAG